MDAKKSKNDCVAFAGGKRFASGTCSHVAAKVKRLLDRDRTATVLIFDALTSEQVEIDFRGTVADVLARLDESVSSSPAAKVPPEPPTRRPGRPKLGVVPREITLLPRHWDWLNSQPGGASIALRKLVEEARRSHGGRDRVRRSQEFAYRFMSAVAGDLPGFEEATRALFAGDAERFDANLATWPADVRDHARTLAADALRVLGSDGGAAVR